MPPAPNLPRKPTVSRLGALDMGCQCGLPELEPGASYTDLFGGRRSQGDKEVGQCDLSRR